MHSKINNILPFRSYFQSKGGPFLRHRHLKFFIEFLRIDWYIIQITELFMAVNLKEHRYIILEHPVVFFLRNCKWPDNETNTDLETTTHSSYCDCSIGTMMYNCLRTKDRILLLVFFLFIGYFSFLRRRKSFLQ